MDNISTATTSIKKMISLNKLDKALILLSKLVKDYPRLAAYENHIIKQSLLYYRTKKQILKNILTIQEQNILMSKVATNLLELLDIMNLELEGNLTQQPLISDKIEISFFKPIGSEKIHSFIDELWNSLAQGKNDNKPSYSINKPNRISLILSNENTLTLLRKLKEEEETLVAIFEKYNIVNFTLIDSNFSIYRAKRNKKFVQTIQRNKIWLFIDSILAITLIVIITSKLLVLKPPYPEDHKTIVINGLEWSSRNLNIPTKNSLCYNDSSKNCDYYGYLYTWKEANEICNSFSNGWRLPSNSDWDSLIELEDSSSIHDYLIQTDGFNFQFGGKKIRRGFTDLESAGYYWSKTLDSKKENAYFVSLYKDEKDYKRSTAMLENMRSVRCVRNKK